MIEAARHFKDYQMVVAGAPSISRAYYNKVLGKQQVAIIDNETYALLTHSVAALGHQWHGHAGDLSPGSATGGLLQDARA